VNSWFAHFNPAFEIEGQIFALFVIVMAGGPRRAWRIGHRPQIHNNHRDGGLDTAEALKGRPCRIWCATRPAIRGSHAAALASFPADLLDLRRWCLARATVTSGRRTGRT